MKNILFAVILSCLSYTISLGNTIYKVTNDTSQAETTQVLDKMQASMKGKTAKGNSYSMYSIKVKKDWVFLLLDTLGISSMKFDEVSDQLVETDKTFTEVLCLAAKSGSLKKRAKPMILADTELECYYKMQGKAAKMFKSVKKMNVKAKEITKRSRTEYRNTKKGISKSKSMKNKLKKTENTKGKSLL